jgi:hypothetical protein
MQRLRLTVAVEANVHRRSVHVGDVRVIAKELDRVSNGTLVVATAVEVTDGGCYPHPVLSLGAR